MSPITHFLMGWVVANTNRSLCKRDRVLVTMAGVVPDMDGLGIIAEWVTRDSSHPLNWWSDYHHVLGHNLGFGLLFSIVACAMASKKRRTWLLALISFHLHLIGDLAGARGPDGEQWPIPYLLPFASQPSLTWPGQWALNAWPNFVITLGLLIATIGFARQRGFSPLEMISRKADSIFVEAIRKRFPLKIRTESRGVDFKE